MTILILMIMQTTADTPAIGGIVEAQRTHSG